VSITSDDDERAALRARAKRAVDHFPPLTPDQRRAIAAKFAGVDLSKWRIEKRH
jgi:hypothetical protein